jgi:hypothetical protein
MGEITKMEFKIDDYIVLTGEGKKFFWFTENESSPVLKVFKPFEYSTEIYGYVLNDERKTMNTLSTKYYRIATESEVKKYKMKNLFIKIGNYNGN